MQIRLGSLLEGARTAEGTVVIIDVFRAFTTAAVAFSRGAAKIVLTAEVGEALELRARGVGELCMGEVDGMRPEGFDFGNSPYELSTADVEGKTLVQSTRAGTVGVAAATVLGDAVGEAVGGASRYAAVWIRGSNGAMLGSVLSFVVVFAVYGAITGGGMVWLLRQPAANEIGPPQAAE